jgi:hypothetical protein
MASANKLTELVNNINYEQYLFHRR